MAVPLRSRLRSEDRRGGPQLLGSSVVEPSAEGLGICEDERPAVRPQDLPGGSFSTDSGYGACQSSPNRWTYRTASSASDDTPGTRPWLPGSRARAVLGNRP